jgi:hypothetical protein
MNDSSNLKKNNEIVEKNQLLGSSIYIKEDDQDWGSAGMNDIQKDSEVIQ